MVSISPGISTWVSFMVEETGVGGLAPAGSEYEIKEVGLLSDWIISEECINPYHLSTVKPKGGPYIFSPT